MVGVELRGTSALAVAVDDSGRVVARMVASDPLEAVDGVLGAPPGGPQPVGVAAIYPDAPEVIAAIKAVSGRHAGSFLNEGAVPSGTAATVAEAWVGAARDAGDVVFFSVADHTSAGIVRGGVPILGSRRRAASVGWLALNPVEREDYRKTGCLEAEVAAAGIVRRMIWRIKAGDRSRIADTVNGDLSAITVDHVLKAARDRDGVSISVMRDTAKYLGMAAANLVVVADPEVLVLGGIMASAADLLMEPVRVEVARRLPRRMMEALKIVPAALGDAAAAIGAARLIAAALQ
jgi:predicted NBD/HSP70 family sugar kinase